MTALRVMRLAANRRSGGQLLLGLPQVVPIAPAATRSEHIQDLDNLVRVKDKADKVCISPAFCNITSPVLRALFVRPFERISLRRGSKSWTTCCFLYFHHSFKAM